MRPKEKHVLDVAFLLAYAIRKSRLQSGIPMKTEWHERLAAFKKYYGYKNADLARMSGNTLQSVKNISQGEVPGWLKFAIQVWENEYSGAFESHEHFRLNSLGR
jgi:hypothetical protein